MKRKEVVDLMTSHMMKLNMDAAEKAGVPESQYKSHMEASEFGIMMLNSSVLDLLIDKGLVQNVE